MQVGLVQMSLLSQNAHGLGTATRITKCLFHDGARIHTSNLSRAFMAGIYGHRILSDRAGGK